MKKHYLDPVCLYLTAFLCLLGVTSCTQIKVRPKNTDWTTFARGVTIHFMDVNPKSYESSQKALASEIVPSVLAQLKTNGQCAKNAAEAKSRANNWKKDKLSSSIKIASADEGDTDEKGLVSVEVKGQLLQTSSKGPQTVPFDVIYKVGVSAASKKPIVASIQFK